MKDTTTMITSFNYAFLLSIAFSMCIGIRASTADLPILHGTLHIYDNPITTMPEDVMSHTIQLTSSEAYEKKVHETLAACNAPFGTDSITEKTPLIFVWVGGEGVKNWAMDSHTLFGPQKFNLNAGYSTHFFPLLFPLEIVTRLKNTQEIQLTIWNKLVSLTAGNNGSDDFETMLTRVTSAYVSKPQ